MIEGKTRFFSVIFLDCVGYDLWLWVVQLNTRNKWANILSEESRLFICDNLSVCIECRTSADYLLGWENWPLSSETTSSPFAAILSLVMWWGDKYCCEIGRTKFCFRQFVWVRQTQPIIYQLVFFDQAYTFFVCDKKCDLIFVGTIIYEPIFYLTRKSREFPDKKSARL